MSGMFSRSRSGSTSQVQTLQDATDFSTRTGKKLSLDPSIRGLQERGLATGAAGQAEFGRAVGDFGSNLGNLRSQLFGNQDPYMQARVAPTQERFAQERGALAQDIGRRGLGGSSFAQQAQTAQSTAQTRDLANLRAMGTQESLQAAAQIDQMLLQAAELERAGDFQQAAQLQAVADQRAQTELAAVNQFGQNEVSSSRAFKIAGSAMGSAGGSS